MASMTATPSNPFASASASVYDPRSFLLPSTRPRQLSEDDDGDDEMDRDHDARRAAASSPSSPQSPQSRYAVILLNQPVPSRQRALFRSIWTHATVRICADGGADRLRDLVQTETDRGGGNEWSLPNAIVGDLDSITESTRDSFAKQGVEIAHRPSQYATDLQKSIQWVEDWERGEQPNVDTSSSTQLDLVIVGGLSGRLDQTAHTLHVLWKLCPPLPSQGGYEDPEAAEQGSARGGSVMERHRAWVVAESSLAVLLPPGQHTLRLPSPPLGKCCGILPFGVDGGNTAAAANVKTQGLEWDLDPQQPQSLGGYLSTSNHVVYPSGASDTAEVVIETDKPIYWSVEI